MSKLPYLHMTAIWAGSSDTCRATENQSLHTPHILYVHNTWSVSGDCIHLDICRTSQPCSTPATHAPYHNLPCLQAHEDRNLARKLTPAEKKEKKLKKLVGEANEGDAPQVAVYRVSDLSNRQHQFKVRVNAQVSPLICALV